MIRGMKMPKNCKECPFCQWSNYYQMYVCFDENRYTEMFFDGKHPTESALRSRRADNCPMTELPEQHGRLIDADALKDTLDYYIREAGWSDEINEALTWVRDEFIDHEPTVIEAEGVSE